MASCVAPAPDPSCTVVRTPDSLPYYQYFSGQYVIENTDNPGNDDPDYPPVTMEYPGTLDMCDAAQLCADNAETEPGSVYSSFDLHYLCSNASWVCVAYYDPSNDPSYFNVPDNDAIYAFGFESCC